MILSVEKSTSSLTVQVKCGTQIFLLLFHFTEYLIPRDVNPVQYNQSIGSIQADISCNSGSEWLMDLSLEDLQDYSVEDIKGECVGSGDSGGGDCDGGDGDDYGDDEVILDRVAKEMDLHISDTTPSSEYDHTTSDADALSNSQSEECCQASSTCNYNVTDMKSNSQYEDLLFDRAYDLYDSKIT